MDKIYPLIAWPTPSITNSLPGHYGLPSLQNLLLAQEKKHQHYFKMLWLKKWMRLLDIWCGWWPFMQYCRKRWVESEGLTLSSAQYNYLLQQWFTVHYNSRQDYQTEKKYDVIVAIGSIEHFVSPVNLVKNQQDNIYKHLFQKIYSRLNDNGTFGWQFMTWDGKEPDYNLLKWVKEIIKWGNKNDIIFKWWRWMKPSDMIIKLHAEKWSKYYHLALLTEFYPWSWLPIDFDHFYKNGEKLFDIIQTIDGREHYIWTMACRGNQFRKWRPWIKRRYITKLLSNFFTDPNFIYWAKAFWGKSNRLCFINNRMGHEFFFLRKK